MKSYLVLGLGRFGQSFAKTLADLGNDVLGVDSDEQIVQESAEFLTHVMQADASSEDFLQAIGVKNYDAVMVSIGAHIQASIITTVLLKEMGVSRIIAKAQNNLHAKILEKVGADKVVLPEQEMGIWEANKLISNNLIDTIELSPDYSIIETTVPSGWAGKSIRDLALRTRYKINLIALKNEKGIDVIPQPDTVFRKEDIIAVVGKNSDLKRFRSSH